MDPEPDPEPDPDPLVRGADPGIRIRTKMVTDSQHCYQDQYQASMDRYKKRLRELNPIKFPSVYRLFLSDRLKHLTDVKPDERMKVAAAEWEQLSEAEKADYEQRFRQSTLEFQAWQERLHTAERSRQDELMYLKQNKVRRYKNVYMFFLAQHLSSLKDVKPTQRMQMAREEWNRLSEAQKAEYESKFREHLVEFKAGVCGFGSELDPDTIGSVDSESGSGSRRTKMTHKSRKEFRNFMF